MPKHSMSNSKIFRIKHGDAKNIAALLNNVIKMINDAEAKVFINYTYIKDIISILENNSKYKEFSDYLKKCIEYLIQIYSVFPKLIVTSLKICSCCFKIDSLFLCSFFPKALKSSETFSSLFSKKNHSHFKKINTIFLYAVFN